MAHDAPIRLQAAACKALAIACTIQLQLQDANNEAYLQLPCHHSPQQPHVCMQLYILHWHVTSCTGM